MKKGVFLNSVDKVNLTTVKVIQSKLFESLFVGNFYCLDSVDKTKLLYLCARTV